MGKLNEKKLLVLGGKPIGSCEIVNYAKEQGVYTIVADYLSIEQSPAKQIADKAWDISTADVDKLTELVTKNNIDGVYAGVHEFNIKKMIEICEKTHRPCFCTLNQWEKFNNKRNFKELCKKYELPVTKEYSDKDEASIEYPVVIKPVDGSGSMGFSLCHNRDEFQAAYNKAIKFSRGGGVLIEKYMKYENSVIVNYTVINGKVYYCGMSDKLSKKVFDHGSPIMAIQFYTSLYEKKYLVECDEKARTMFESVGVDNGVIWIEIFCDKGDFTFNEMGFRFGGSLTYLPVQYFYGINQLELQVDYALTGCAPPKIRFEKRNEDKIYCILPLHVKPGVIAKIDGLDKLKKRKELIQVVPVHYVGDTIENWGSAQQVLAYVHFVIESRHAADEFVQWITDNVKVLSIDGQQLLFNLYNS